ncbi:MAG: peptidoglycan bridge formation glycyltransferase FemA/FemB family protein [Deltaproteobacteria bacterium]|nr:peptidoglycan bridge formation glycyltransferase FemA/FemB family protein [Deltaproteobacteria bacterium]
MWKYISRGEAEDCWDRWLVELDQPSVFQSFEWGEYKRLTGWQVDRWVITGNDSRLAAAQVISKRLPFGVTMAWVPGGPLFKLERPGKDQFASLLSGLKQTLLERFGKNLYVRLNMSLPTSPDLTFHVRQVFRRVLVPINSGYTYHLQIPQDEVDLLKRLSKKHRYYARRSLSAPIGWSEGNKKKDCQDFLEVHRQMARNKGLDRLALVDDDIRLLLRCFSGQASIVTGYSDNKPVTTCLILMAGKSAFYYLAATNDYGREMSASYGMVLKAMEMLSRLGVSDFDMGGIDPEWAQGVNHFKKGFGGRMIQYLGEWDYPDMICYPDQEREIPGSRSCCTIQLENSLRMMPTDSQYRLTHLKNRSECCSRIKILKSYLSSFQIVIPFLKKIQTSCL